MTTWPLPRFLPEIPEADHAGSFGAVRKHDVHTGVDLYCQVGARVVAVEAGEIILIEPFTGPMAGSPWWNATHAVWVYNRRLDRTLVYGEVLPRALEGRFVEEGEPLGHVQTVLKKDKGLPMTMLHFEMYDGVPNGTVWWTLDEPCPPQLMDPTALLLEARRERLREAPGV